MMDGNGDSRVTFEEFELSYSAIDPEINVRTIKSEFNKMDRDGEGSVDFQEFCHYMANKYAAKKRTFFRSFVTAVTGFFGAGNNKRKETPAPVAAPQKKEADVTAVSKPTTASIPRKAQPAPESAPALTTKLTDGEVHALFERFDINNRNGK